jgi:hypothetical protein
MPSSEILTHQKMKKLIPAIIAALLLLCICFVLFFRNKSRGETTLAIKDTERHYIFKASFYPGATPGVSRYIDSCTSLLRKENASFRVKISDGDLTITADKQANAAIVITHIKKMCQGISDTLIQY